MASYTAVNAAFRKITGGSALGVAACGAVLCALFFVPLVMLGPVGGSSEAREGHVAWIIWSTGEWILPLRNGLVPSKPPLYHWLVAGAAQLLGAFSIELARFCTAVTAAITVGITGLLAFRFSERILVGESSAVHARSGYLAMLLLIATYGFNVQAVTTMVDMSMTMLTTAAIAAVFLGVTAPSYSPLGRISGRYFACFFIFAALAVVAKGPLGFVLPSIVVFGALLTLSGFRSAVMQCFRPRLVWLLAAVVALGWYWVAAQQGGGAFVERQLFFENLQRFFGGELVNAQPWWFYAPELLLAGAPTVLLFLFSATVAIREHRSTGAELPRDARYRTALALLPVIWVLVGVLLFSVATGKRRSYLLPLYPGMALSVALYLQFLLSRGLSVTSSAALIRWSRRIGVAILTTLLLGFLAVQGAFYLTGATIVGTRGLAIQWALSVATPLSFALLGSALLLGVSLHLGRSSVERRVLSIAIAVAVALSVATHGGIGLKNHLRGFDLLSQKVMEIVPSHTPLAVVRTRADEYFDPVLFYLQREVQIIDPEQPLPSLGESFVLARDRDRTFLEGAGGFSAEPVLRSGQRGDKFSGRTDRDIVLYRITKRESAQPAQ